MKCSESVSEFREIFLSLGLLATQIQMQTMIVNTPVRFRKVLGPEESWKFTWFLVEMHFDELKCLEMLSKERFWIIKQISKNDLVSLYTLK